MAQENFSSNYWLGGYHTGGKIRGANWLRGRWSGGNWDKGNFYSVDLNIDWQGVNKNLWSKWSGGVWRSNSQDYTFVEYGLTTEWSIWHGGTWESAVYPKQTYTWQGPFINAVNIYGDLTPYDCDIPSNNTLPKRTIYLPSPKSLWLGGQWLRGDFKGGIFSGGVWHSLKWEPSQYEYLDNLFFLYGDGVLPFPTEIINIDGNNYFFIDNDNEGQIFTIFLYNDAEFFQIDLSIQYEENNSNFYQGAFVNSIWEGGVVLDTSNDPFNTVFGMAIDTETSLIQDDSGVKGPIGFLESNQLLYKRYFGLKMLDFARYYDNNSTNSVNQIISIRNNNTYWIPSKYETGGVYSVIWKRGKFKNGAFMYGQWYDYDDKNIFKTSYATDLNIHVTYDDYDVYDLPVYWSVFEKGFFYNSVWYNGVFLTKNSTSYKKSVFSRSQWMTGYWANGEDNSTTFSNDRKTSDADFWKSVWYSGIWEGGKFTMSVWNAFNPYSFQISLEGNTIAENIEINSTPFANIENNPLGLTTALTYYNLNGSNTVEFNGFINDVSKIDLIKIQPIEGFDFDELTVANLDFYIEGEGDTGGYDFNIDDDGGTSGLPYLYLSNADEFFVNDNTVNQMFLRYAGQVDNFSSRWKNGNARGVMWNGGIWSSGVFESYYFSDYPSYILERRSDTIAQYDWFDDNVINLNVVDKIQQSVWQRGIWYAGYMKGNSYFTGISAFKGDNNIGFTLSLDNKFGFNDDLLTGQYNVPTAEIVKLRPNNFTSFFTRKSLRDADVPYFSMFNGQMLSGIFYDINKNGTDTPGFGTLAFADDLTLAPNGATFGRVTYDVTKNPDAIVNNDPINANSPSLSFRIKNTFNTGGVDINISTPYAFDSINATLGYTLTTQQYIDLYYYNSLQTIVQATGNDSNYNIKHAAKTGNMPKWTDILPINTASTRVPSIAQGDGKVEEPSYDSLPIIWLDSGYGQ